MTIRVDVIPATEAHILPISGLMRAADADEVLASNGLSPRDALAMSLATSTKAWTGLVDGVPVCMFGVAPQSFLDSRYGKPWLLSTGAVERHQKAFLRRNKAKVSEMLAEFPILQNWVDDRNVMSIKWLQWLGFTVGSPVPYGPLGMPFRMFEMRRSVPVVVRKCRVDEILSNGNLPSLHREFADEVATFAQPAPLDKMDGYRAIEAAGGLQAYGAFMGDLLVGFVTVLVSAVPRISIPIAVADGVFVGKRYRKTGAGLKLIRAAERHAADHGSPVLMIGTPSNGPLATVLPAIGYAETNRVFTKEIRHG